MINYGIWIDGEFVIINDHAPLTGPYGWASMWERFINWARGTK